MRASTAARRAATTSSAKEGGHVEIVVTQVELVVFAWWSRRRCPPVSEAAGRCDGARSLLAGPAALFPALEAGRDDGDPHLVTHVVVDDRAEDDVGVGMGHAVDDLGRLVHLEQSEVGTAGDVEQDAPRPFDGRLEQGLVMAARAALAARPSPMEAPMPMMAVPALVMTIFTSAKSVLMRPGHRDEVGDAPHTLEQHLVGHFEGVDHARLVVGHASGGGHWE